MSAVPVPSKHDLAMADMMAAAQAARSTERAARVAAAIVTPGQIRAQSEPPPQVVEDFLHAREVHLLNAEGGIGKTTMMVCALVDYVLGQRVLGEFAPVEPRGPVLIVTSEDRREQLLYVINQTLAARYQSDATRTEAERRVAEMMFVWDVTHAVTVLHARSREAPDWTWSMFGLELTDMAKECGARIVLIDPLGMFAGGDENSNADTQRLMKDLRAKVADECGAAVIAVHHVSKDAARNGTNDQYTGRGATALPNAARGVMQMVKQRERSATLYGETWVVPAAITDDHLRNGQALLLTQHKYSPRRTWAEPRVVLRDGYTFRAYPMQQRGATDQQAAADRADDRAVLAWLAQRELPFPYAEVISLRATIPTTKLRKDWSKRAVDAALGRLVLARLIATEGGGQGKQRLIVGAEPAAALDDGEAAFDERP